MYNLADDLPASRQDVFSYARHLLRNDGPAEGTAPANAEARIRTKRDRKRSSKRVSNARMHSELVSELKYPSYLHGLSALYRGSLWPYSAQKS